jgi:hypothetical protein
MLVSLVVDQMTMSVFGLGSGWLRPGFTVALAIAADPVVSRSRVGIRSTVAYEET